MNRYEKYKDSGIAWIGEIPEKWSVLKLSGLYAVRNEKVSDKDFPALSVTMQGIVPQLATAAKTDDGDNRKLVRIGDFAINSRSDRRGSCGVSAHNGSVSLINTILTPRSEMSSTFYNWLLRTSLFSDEYYKWGHGIVDDLWTTRWQEMKNISVTSPPIAEQEAIAEFLDGKCEEVDRLVGLQQAMIGELVAYKQSVITECVTKGLDHSAPLRDSDIPWIGSIPQHWDNGRLKNIISERLQYGANENGISYSSNLPRYVRITDIIDNELKENIEKQSLPEDVAKDYILKDGDVLFARSGGTVGKSFLYKAIYGKCAFAGYLIRASVNSDNSSQYLYYYTKSSSYIEWKNRIFIQATIQNIGADKYSIMEIPIPPLQEQQAIADHLDHKCEEIDNLIAIKREKIEQLKEYKKSVIFEYVTGKKRVN